MTPLQERFSDLKKVSKNIIDLTQQREAIFQKYHNATPAQRRNRTFQEIRADFQAIDRIREEMRVNKFTQLTLEAHLLKYNNLTG